MMACLLIASSHYLNRWWFIISAIQWHSFEGNFTRDTPAINYWNKLDNYLPKMALKTPRGQWIELLTLTKICMQRKSRRSRLPIWTSLDVWRKGMHTMPPLWFPHLLPLRTHCKPVMLKITCVLYEGDLKVQGHYSLSGRTAYRKIPWSIEAARFGFRLSPSLWNLTGASAATDMSVKFQSDTTSITSDFAASRLRTRSGGTMAYRLVNRGPGYHQV